MPGTALFQFLSLPLVGLIWAILWVAGRLVGEAHGIALVVWMIVGLGGTFGIYGFASLLGFISGWGIGSKISDGWTIGAAVRASIGYRMGRRLLGRAP